MVAHAIAFIVFMIAAGMMMSGVLNLVVAKKTTENPVERYEQEKKCWLLILCGFVGIFIAVAIQ